MSSLLNVLNKNYIECVLSTYTYLEVTTYMGAVHVTNNANLLQLMPV